MPRGFAVVHAESPGTGHSDGCPTSGGRNETLAAKAVIDWLNGRVPAYTTRNGDTQAVASWSTGHVGMIGTSYNGTIPEGVAKDQIGDAKNLSDLKGKNVVLAFYPKAFTPGCTNQMCGYRDDFTAFESTDTVVLAKMGN